MLELRASGQLKSVSLEFAFQAKFERRFRLGDLSDLAEIGESPISPCKRAAAVRAYENYRRAGLKFDRPGARRTVGGEYCYTSPPAATDLRS